MGVTISYELTTTKPLIPDLLQRAERTAIKFKEIADKVNISFTIFKDKRGLRIDIGNCETLSFVFMTPKQINDELKKEGYSYMYNVLTKRAKITLDEGYEIKKYPQNEKVYCAQFCKTQFADNIIEHIWVAEIIRSVASYCKFANVRDEGDYYYTAKAEDAINAIRENGKIIDSIMGELINLGYEETNMIKGNTNIKPLDLN